MYLGMLEQLENNFSEIVVPEKVRQEVVDNGKEIGAKDAYRVEEKLGEDWMEVKEAPENSEIRDYNLEKGELAALAISIEKDIETILTDEENVREVARLHGLNPRGTLYFLFTALKHSMDFSGYLEKLETLAKEGFHMSEEVYINAVRKGRELSDKN